MKTYTSKEILSSDLYSLQDSFSCSGSPFKYQLTKEEFDWVKFIKGKYCIADFIFNNIENLVLTFSDPFALSEALINDGIPNKAVMLSDDTALQKLFFWLNIND